MLILPTNTLYNYYYLPSKMEGTNYVLCFINFLDSNNKLYFLFHYWTLKSWIPSIEMSISICQAFIISLHPWKNMLCTKENNIQINSKLITYR